MLAMIMKFIKARGFPYIALGAIALLAGAYGLGRFDGTTNTAAKYTRLMNEALERQIMLERKLAQADLVEITVSATRRTALAHIIRTIEIPADPADCYDPQWLQSFNQGVRAVNANTGRADAAP